MALLTLAQFDEAMRDIARDVCLDMIEYDAIEQTLNRWGPRIMKQPKPIPMAKTTPKTSPSGKVGAPDMTIGGKPVGPPGQKC